MIDKVPVDKCCLCKACSNVCPMDAISFDKENGGFDYPVIDKDKCVSCDKCENVCPDLADITEPNAPYPIAYAAKARDEIRMKSTSGGLFFELAKRVILDGGYVCGAVFDDGFLLKHVVTNDICVLEHMRGSKYVQSDIGNVYKRVEEILKAGDTVLFSGCPCQTAALHSFLQKEYSNLLTVDFICHGIPSQKMFDSYRSHMEEKYRSPIEEIQFRSKALGWHSSSVEIRFENGKRYCEPITVNEYMRAFLSGTMMKSACYSCRSKNFRSCSDITLGDFWGAELVFPDWDDNKGISAVLVNTGKGEALFESIDVEKNTTEKKLMIKYNRNIIEPTKVGELREAFLSFANEYGFAMAISHFFEESRWEKYRRKLKYKVRCLYYRLNGKGRPLY